LEVLYKAHKDALNEHNIRRSWEKISLFLYNPEVIIRALPCIILQREKEAQEAKARARQPPAPTSRPTTSGRPAPLDFKTLGDVNSMNAILGAFAEIKNTLATLAISQEEQN
jgi:hypothetical protein